MSKPKIRFKGYEEDWEQRKLSDITLKIGSGKTPSGGKNAYVDDGIPLIRSQNINNDRVDLEDIVFIDEETDNSMENSRVFTDDVLLNITGASIGRSAVYRGKDKANVNQHVCIIRPTKDFDSDFIQLNLASNFGQKQIDASQAGGGREGLNFQEIGKMSFMFPSNQEQMKIGVYFNHIDYLITLHQRKCEETKKLKKYMLQKMFPQNGKRVPEIRFAGFTDDWEQRKLGDVLEEFSNKSTVEDEYTVLSSTNTGMEFRDGRVSGRSNLGYKIIEIDDLVLSPQNLWLGNININNLEKGLVSPSYKTFKLRNIDKEFFRPQLRTKKMLELYKQSSVQGASVVRRNLDMDLFEQIELNIPKIEEQAKIGEYFFNLDHLITLHQCK